MWMKIVNFRTADAHTRTDVYIGIIEFVIQMISDFQFSVRSTILSCSSFVVACHILWRVKATNIFFQICCWMVFANKTSYSYTRSIISYVFALFPSRLEFLFFCVRGWHKLGVCVCVANNKPCARIQLSIDDRKENACGIFQTHNEMIFL